MAATRDLEHQLGNLQLQAGEDERPGYFHGDWIDTALLTPEIASSVISAIRVDYQEAEEDDNEMLLTLYYDGVEYISDLASVAFLAKIARNPQAGAEMLRAERLLQMATENQIIDNEYLEGIRFVLRILGKFVRGGRDEGLGDGNEAEYQTLRSKACATILAMKDYFLERLPGAFWGFRDGEPRKMLQMDPGSAEWHLRAYKEIWHQYRGAQDRGAKAEHLKRLQQSIEAALEIDSEHPKVLMHYIECLRECGRRFWPREGLQFAGKGFESLEQIKEEIMDKIKKILDTNATVRVKLSFVMTLAIRSNSSHSLDRMATAAELELARQLLNEARETCAESGRVLHKLGLFTLVVESNTRGAVAYFRNALASWPHFFSALVDLVMTMMANPEENEAEILRKIDENLEAQGRASPWSADEKKQLLHHKGNLLFMLGRYEEAIECWAESFWGFESLKFRLDRYKWPQDKINLQLILSEVRAASGRDPANEQLRKMKEAAEEVWGKNQRYDQWNVGHGRARGRIQQGYQPRASFPRAPPPFVPGNGRGSPSGSYSSSSGYSTGYSRARSSNSQSEADRDDNWRN